MIISTNHKGRGRFESGRLRINYRLSDMATVVLLLCIVKIISYILQQIKGENFDYGNG